MWFQGVKNACTAVVNGDGPGLAMQNTVIDE